MSITYLLLDGLACWFFVLRFLSLDIKVFFVEHQNNWLIEQIIHGFQIVDEWLYMRITIHS
jgi:hypothetical protein